MKLKVHSVALVAAVVLMTGTISAKTVAWYHFNEGNVGDYATGGSAVIENAADPGSLTGVPYAILANSTSVSTTGAWLPVYSNDFPQCVSWYDPETKARGEDNRCLFLRSSDSNGNGQSGVVFVEDDEKLHCTNITVEFMAKLQPGVKLLHWAHILMLRNAAANNVKAWALEVNPDGKVSFQMHTRNEAGTGVDSSKSIDTGFASAAPSVVDGNWHHIAFTYDGSYVRLYIDYVQRNSKAWTNPIDYNGDCAGRLCIGGNDMATYGRWQGFIDEVRISDEALPPEKFLHPSVLPGTEKAVDAAKVTDQDTALYLSFDLSAEPFFAINESVSSNALPLFCTLSTNGILPNVETSAIVSNTVHSGIFATNSAVNGGCWRFGQNAGTDGQSVHIEVDDYSKNNNVHLISSGDFTIEYWINVPGNPSRSCYVIAEMSKSSATGTSKGQPGTLLMYTTTAGAMYCRLVSQKALDEYQTNNVSLAYNDASKSGVCDGKWHHVALVVDRKHQLASFYVDYTLVQQHKDFVLASRVANTASYKPLEISGGWGPNRQDEFHNLSIDELRITRRALAPQEFLTRGENSSTASLVPVRAWMGFEGDLSVKPDSGNIPTGRVAAATVAYSALTPKNGRALIDGTGELIRETNNSSLWFSKSGRIALERNILLERDMESQTVEFFMRATNGSAVAWAYFVRMFNNAEANGNQGNRIWSIGYGNAAGDLYVTADTDYAENQVKYFNGSNLDDGRWHHIAVTLEPDGNGDTTVKFYKDYKQHGNAQTVRGLLQTSRGPVPYSCVRIGADYDGWLDELRISQGVLTVDQMMHVLCLGTVLHVR